MNPKVSIVILNWNGRNYLEEFIPSILASTYDGFDLVVADNASTDDSVAFLQEIFPTVRLICLSENHGFSKGYNEALKQVSADYFVLLNSDVRVEPGWIEPVIQLMEHDKNIGICQPRILTQKDPSFFEYAGGAGGWLDYFGYPFARGRIFDVCEEDKGQYNEVQPVFWASGAAMFVRASVYQELNGLDEYFFAHQEEIDFCWRAQLRGVQVYACPASVVYHVGGGTLPKGDRRKVFLNFRNNLIMLSKNLPLIQLLWKLPFRIFLDAVSAVKQLLSGEPNYFIAVLGAHLAYCKWLVTPKDIRFYSSKRGMNGLKGLYRGSIVWQHFVKGKKWFWQVVKK